MFKDQQLPNSNNNLLGFVPAIVVDNLMEKIRKKEIRKIPERQNFNSVVMFADISGFTNLSEKLTLKGYEGAELLAFALTRYMEFLVKSIGKSGGDIFKFAGDAMIIIWPPPQHNTEEELTTLCRQAIQSSLDIQSKLHEIKLVEDIKLSVKIGFGVGQVTILHVGGVFSRAEYLAAGDPLKEAFECEHLAPGGGYIIISDNMYKRVMPYFEFELINDKEHHGNGTFYYIKKVKRDQKVRMKADALLLNTRIKPSDIEAIRSSLVSYIPAAVMPFIELDEEKWSHELRRLSIMFCNLGIDLNDAKTNKGLERIQIVIETVQKCVYKYQGSLNKLLMDDKGSTLMIIFGLYPMAHQDDPVRAVLTGISLIKDLKKINCSCSVGVATGVVFAGVVGTSGSRREFSVLGDKVNLSARFMQAACKEKERKIFVDETTKSLAECKIAFKFAMQMPVKGKSGEIPFFQPLDPEEDPEVFSFPYNIRTHMFTPQKNEAVISPESYEMVGKHPDECLKKSLILIEKFLKKMDNNVLILITGGFGSGKSLFVRNLLDKTYKLTETIIWKYQETALILVSTLNCGSKALPFNGWRSIAQQILLNLALRTKTLVETLMIKLLENDPELLNSLHLVADILGLKLAQKKEGSSEPIKIQDKDMKIIKRIILKLFSAFLEEQDSLDDDSKFSNHSSQNFPVNSLQSKFNSPPLIIVLEDMQDYDTASWSFAKKLIKRMKKVILIAVIRDKYCEIPPSFAKRTSELPSKQRISGSNEESGNKSSHFDWENLPLEEKLEHWASELEESCDPSGFLKVELNGMTDEESRLYIRKILKTSGVTIEASPEKEEVLNDASLRNFEPHKWKSQNSGNIKKEVSHKEITMKDDNNFKIIDVFLKTLNSRTEGKPMDIVQLMVNLKNMGYVKTNLDNLIISHKVKKIFEIKQFLTIEPPLSRISINGEILDRLETHAYLLLKIAAIIGEEFDMQMLLKVNPFQLSIPNEKLRRIIIYLEKSDIIEILDENEHNIVYRFLHPFMREIIYNRMLFSQRRQLHRFVAEAMQASPFQNEADEKVEVQKLIYNWCLAENLDATQLENSQFSNKAKRSLIVKKISSLLSKNQHSLNIILKSGCLEKKSDHGMSWSSRFLVLNCKDLKYYYSEADFKKNTDFALGVISLKHIFKIFYLDEKETKKKYAFVIYTGSWQKKNKEMGVREFYFSSNDYSSLENWTTYLEFLRAKAIYDDFVYSFGKISFPLTLGDRYDDASKESKHSLSRMTHALENNRASYKSPNLQRKNTLSASRKMTIMKGINKQIVLNTIQEVMASNANQENAKRLKDRLSRFIITSLKLFISQILETGTSHLSNVLLGQTTQIFRKIPYHIEDHLLEDNRGMPVKSGNLTESQDLREYRESSGVKGSFENFPENLNSDASQNMKIDTSQSNSNNSVRTDKRFSEDAILMNNIMNNNNNFSATFTPINNMNTANVKENPLDGFNKLNLNEIVLFPKSKSNLEMITEVEEMRSQSISLVMNQDTPNNVKSNLKPSHFAMGDDKKKNDFTSIVEKKLESNITLTGSKGKHRSTLDDFDENELDLSPSTKKNPSSSSLFNKQEKGSTEEIIEQIEPIFTLGKTSKINYMGKKKFKEKDFDEKTPDLLSETILVSKNPHKNESSSFTMLPLKTPMNYNENNTNEPKRKNSSETFTNLPVFNEKQPALPLIQRNFVENHDILDKIEDSERENIKDEDSSLEKPKNKIPKVLLRKEGKVKEEKQEDFMQKLSFRVFPQEKPKIQKANEKGNLNYGKINFFKKF